MKPVRLARRFFASVLARPPTPEEREWVRSVLTAGEFPLWDAQPRYDLRHTLGVGRRVEGALGREREDRWVAAALLHDVGKVESGLGVAGRVLATLVMGVAGRRRVRGWAARPGWRGRFGRYADHGEIGARLIRSAGGREEAARWAAVHHLPKLREAGEPDPNLPAGIVLVLHDCDRD